MSASLLDEVAAHSDDPRVRGVARLAGRQLASRKRGRPTSLNRVVASRVIGYVLNGAYVATACQAVGINRHTFYNWENRASEWTGPEMDWEDIPERELIYVHFFHALKLAEAQGELKLLRRAASGERGWQAAMTVLERKYPSRWGRSEKRIHEGGDPAKPPVIIVESEADRQKRVAKVLHDAGELED